MCPGTELRSEQPAHRQSRLQFVSNSAVVAAEVRDARNNLEVKIRYSKRLPQCNKDLCGFNAGQRTQVVAKIHSDWSDWCRIPEADADGIAVVFREVFESDAVEDIASII